MTLYRNKFWLAGLAGFALTACDTGVSLEGAPVSEAPIAMERSATVSADMSIAPAPMPVMPSRYKAPRNARRGVVTAGDVDDALNLAAFARYQAAAAKRLSLPRTNLGGMISAQVKGPSGKPAAGVAYTLTKAGSAQPFHQGYSGVDGMIRAFPAALGAGRPSRVVLKTFEEGQQARTITLKAGVSQTVQIQHSANTGWKPDFMDIVLVIDTTGSMGDELAWLTREFQGVVRSAQRAAPGVDIRYGLIAYRDDGDAYKLRNFGMTSARGKMQSWLKSLDASGGGDYPEAAAEALEAAAALPWRRGKGERLVFHVADAPAHKAKASRFLRAAQSAAGQNVQIFGLGASGVAKESEFLMRQAALVTGGRYMFLTDDSGVGNAHAEPTIACYRVTKLKELLTRVLRSELSGKRVEAGSAIREVGNYNKGRCSQ